MGVKDFGNIQLSWAKADRNEFEQAVRSLIFMSSEEAKNKVLTKRSLIQWELPHLGQKQYIEMYINPQNINFVSRKEINRVRTKGGYIAQYWGEDLDIITITGTTGDSGIEGINVMRDIYRSEQLALNRIVTQNGAAISLTTASSIEDKRRQSLMQLATSVIMWYQGQGYRGFFTDMSYTESVDKLGLFDYSLSFSVVEILGQRRKNFLPWHRHPWSTTETPNQGVNQSQRGGGYTEGKKVGALNIPPFRLNARAVRNTEGSTVGVIQVAILRPDPKDVNEDGSHSRVNTDTIQRIIDSSIPTISTE